MYEDKEKLLTTLERKQRKTKQAAAHARHDEIVAREAAKRATLQAELDALQPKTAAMKRYQSSYLDRVKGAKRGGHLGGRAGLSVGVP